MAYEYQTGEDRLPIGGRGEVLPEELSNAYFQNLDRMMALQEGKQMERVLGELSNRGFLRSGDTFTQVAENVLGPAQERRNALLLPELKSAASAGREERLGEVQFGRQKELSRQEYLQRLDELDKQAKIKRMLMELEADLNSPSGDIFEQILGQGLGAFTGAFAGRAGGRASSSLFGD